MVGVKLPLIPLMHQYIMTKPIPGFELSPQTPVLRDPDNLFYAREEVKGVLVGGFEPNPREWNVNSVPWDFSHQLLDFDFDYFEPVMQGAMKRIPQLEDAEVHSFINGPDSCTPDSQYLLGPIPNVPGFFVAAGMSLNGISGGGGVGSLMADWIIDGRPSIPLNDMDIRRFGPHYSSDLERTIQQSRETYKFYYSLHYPRDEREWGRKWRKSALFERLLQEGGVIGEKMGGRERITLMVLLSQGG